MKLIDADKLKERVVDLKFTTEGIKTLINLIDELSVDRKDDTIEALLKAVDYNESMQDYSISTETIRAIITKNNQQQPSPLRVVKTNGINSDDAGSNFNIISDEVKADYLCHRVNKLEADNAALRKEIAELKLKLKEDWKQIDEEILEVLNSFGSKSDEIMMPRVENPMKKINELTNQFNDAIKIAKGIIELQKTNQELETDNADLCKEITELKLKLKDLSE